LRVSSAPANLLFFMGEATSLLPDNLPSRYPHAGVSILSMIAPSKADF
jgi:hypothetical protein